MVHLPTDRRYTKTHEWIQIHGNHITIGITDHAQEQLGDLVYVQLPEVGDSLHQGDEVVTLESVKAAADVCSPVDGTVTAVNESLEETPEIINKQPYETWLVQIETNNTNTLDDLCDADAYQQYIHSE